MNVCIRAHRFCDESSNTSCHNCPGHHLIVRVFRDRVHLASEVRFIHFKTSAVDNSAVSWNLISGTQQNEVAENYILCMDINRCAITNDCCRWCMHKGKTVEFSFCNPFLNDSDCRVSNEWKTKKTIGDGPSKNNYNEESAKNSIEACEDICAKNFAETTRCFCFSNIGLSRGDPLGDFSG